MLTTRSGFFSAIVVALLVAGCGSGGGGGSDDGTSNSAPTASDATLDTARSLEAEKALSASDPDGDSLSWSITTDPQHGTASLDTSSTLTYQPDDHWAGEDSLTVEVSDGNGGTDTAEVAVTVTGLNDTGQINCGDYAYGSDNSGNHHNDVDCASAGATQDTAGTDGADSDPVPAGQDAVYGRDDAERNGTLTKTGGGNAGFDFTKIDADGNALDASATDWTCVRDNVTGLTWEAKTDGDGLRDKDHTYTWYNSDSENNGGNAGTQDGGTCTGGIDCDTESYVSEVNSTGLCGHSDWRLPTRQELRSLVDNSKTNPAVDTTGYFRNTVASPYWSASPDAKNSDYAWYVDFNHGDVDNGSKQYGNYGVRLVRGGQ